MPFRTLKLVGSALVAAAMLPAAASAQYYGNVPASYYGDRYDRDGYGYDLVYAQNARDRRGYRREAADRDPPPPRRASYRDRRVERCDRGNAGTILGAIAGGLLGDAPAGRHGNRGAGTLAGSADRDCD